MANRRMYLDKSEITVLIPCKKKVEDVHLSSGQITRIQFDKCTERMLLVIPQQSEKITIVSSKRANPIVMTKGQSSTKPSWPSTPRSITSPLPITPNSPLIKAQPCG